MSIVCSLIPVITKIKPIRPKIIALDPPAPLVSASLDDDSKAKSGEYDKQFSAHCHNLLNTAEELRQILIARNRIDPKGKEVNRKKVFEILNNLTSMMKEYPPKIYTNLQIGMKSRHDS